MDFALHHDVLTLIFSRITDKPTILALLLSCKLFNRAISHTITCIDGYNSITHWTLEKLPRIKRVRAPIFIGSLNYQVVLPYLTSRKLLQINMILFDTGYWNSTREIVKFLEENLQLDTYRIMVGNKVTDRDSVSLLNGIFTPTDYLNSQQMLLNPNIKIVDLRKLEFTVDDISQYKNLSILMGTKDVLREKDHVDVYPLFRMKEPRTIMLEFDGDISFDARSKVPHTFIYNHTESRENFIGLMTNLLYKYPKANYENVVFNLTKYKQNTQRELEEQARILRASSKNLSTWENRDKLAKYQEKLNRYHQLKYYYEQICQETYEDVEVDGWLFNIHVKRKFKTV